MRYSTLIKNLCCAAALLALFACGGGGGGGETSASGGSSSGSGNTPPPHGTITSALQVVLGVPLYAVADSSYSMQAATPGPLLAVHATQLPNGNAVWIAASANALWLSSTQGASWQLLRSFSYADLGAGNDGAASTSYRIVGFDVDPVNANLFTLALASYGSVSGTAATLVYHSSDGHTLVPVFTNDLSYAGTALSGPWLDSRVPLVGLSQQNGSGITLAAEDGTLLTSTDAGANWTVQTAASVNSLPASIAPQQGTQVHWALSASNAIASYSGHLWVSRDGGKTGQWEALATPVTGEIPAVNPAGQIALVYAQQVSNDGRSWSKLSNPNNLAIGDAMFWLPSGWYSHSLNADYANGWQAVPKTSPPTAYQYAAFSNGWTRVDLNGNTANCTAPAGAALTAIGGAVVAWSANQGVLGISQDGCATWSAAPGSTNWRRGDVLSVQNDGLLYTQGSAGTAPQVSLDGGASWRTLGAVPASAPMQIIPTQNGGYALFDAQGNLMTRSGSMTPASAAPMVSFDSPTAPAWLANGEEALLGQSCPTGMTSTGVGVCHSVLVLFKLDAAGTQLQLDRSVFVDGGNNHAIRIAQDGKSILLASVTNGMPDRWLTIN